jgi:hypothetical protein
MGTVMTDAPGSERAGQRARLVIAAVLLAMMLVATAFAALVAWDASRDLTDVREDVDTLVGPTRALQLVGALQDERTYAATYLLGIENAIEQPVDSIDEATAATDEALAAFRSDVAGRGGDLADAYGPVLSGIDDPLTGLRESVGAVTGPRSLNQNEATQPIYAGYMTIIDELLGAGDSMALDIDDPELRQGTQLLNRAFAQPELVVRIGRQLVLAGVAPGGRVSTPEQIAAIAADKAELLANEAEIESLATGSYEDVAVDRAGADTMSEFLAVVDESIEGATVNLAAVTTSLGRTGGPAERYGTMQDTVQAKLADRAADLRHEAETRRTLWFALAGAAAVAAAVTLVVLVR